MLASFVVCGALSLGAMPGLADAGEGTASIGANFTAGGIQINAREAVLRRGTSSQGVSSVHHLQPRLETTVTPACPGNDPNSAGAYDVSCQTLVSACQAVGLAGPLTWWWSRPLNVDGSPAGPWVRVGQSCTVPALVAAAVARPVLTLAAVRTAFRQVAFALPQVHVQPEGGVTLVNLPTFFEVRWPVQGVQPGEVASVDMLGRSVRVRPLVRSFVYRFGDGAGLGPTTDAGGVYPAGTVRHVYTRPVVAMVSVSATYGGQFSVDGGPWQQVGETITLTGPATGVQVLEARARLEAG